MEQNKSTKETDKGFKLFIFSIIAILMIICIMINLITGRSDVKLDGEPSLRIEQTLDKYAVELSGTLKNYGKKDCSYVKIIFDIIDDNGNSLGTVEATTNFIESNGVWNFTTTSFVESGLPSSYKLIEIKQY